MKPLVLMILDGWGIAPPGPGNAISLSKLSNIPDVWTNFPHTELSASGERVGLPDGEDGNTETGHVNIGAGRIVYQDLPRINHAISDGSFFANKAFLGAIQYTCEHKSNLHIMGVLSDSGVHASREHIEGLLKLIKQSGCCSNVFLHLFTDGRDAPPQSGLRFVRDIEFRCQTIGIGMIATIMGRYYAMDRDLRWERTEKAYKTLTELSSDIAPSAISAIQSSYRKGITDEFIVPTIICDPDGNPYPRIDDHDSVIFFNYRIDRPRQLTRAFVQPDFESGSSRPSFDPYAVKYFHKHVIDVVSQDKPFTRTVKLPDIFFVTMTEYDRNLSCSVAFPPNRVHLPLGNIISSQNLRQLRVSESEKERFVTYYFNGLREDPYPGEDRLIVPSPKVATYDLQPEMSLRSLTEFVLNKISSGMYSFIVINVANPDMVGHTGNISAAIRACEVTDECVGKIMEKTLLSDGTCIITADHGNVEEMLASDGSVDTEHSTFPVPFIMVNKYLKSYPQKLPNGSLCDIAPTILSYLGIAIPKDMTGKNLLADLPVRLDPKEQAGRYV